jgi:DNA-binding response OmpR family regulator
MRKKVLIADDEPNIIMSLQFLMEYEGYEVRTVGDGEAALQCLRDFRPDLVLLDVMMPKRNGYEICQVMRTTPELRGIKILMLTAKGRDIDAEKGLALGADSYVTKPFATKTLVARVKAMLGDA